MFAPSILCLVFLVLTLAGEGWGFPRVRVGAKPLASICFVGAGLEVGLLSEPYGLAIFVALVLSFAGDVLLIPKDSKACFLGGLGAFLLAHVAFAVAFILTGAMQWQWTAWVSLPFCLLAWATARWLLPSVSASMKKPVVAYILVITAMVILAWSCDAGFLAPAAATLFFLSDISVAIDRFRGGGFLNRLWGLPAYYAAQLLFVYWFAVYSASSVA